MAPTMTSAPSSPSSFRYGSTGWPTGIVSMMRSSDPRARRRSSRSVEIRTSWAPARRRVLGLRGAAGDRGDLGAQRLRQLDRHEPEAAEPGDADLRAGPRAVRAQRRPRRDPGAQHRRGAGGVEPVGDPQDEALLHRDGVRVAAERRMLEVRVRRVVRVGALRAVLLQAALAGVALAARVDDAAHPHGVARRERRDARADLAHAADDLVAGQARVRRAVPLVARGVQVGVADAAPVDVDEDVALSRRTPLEVDRGELGVGRRSGPAPGGKRGKRGHVLHATPAGTRAGRASRRPSG